MTYLKGNIEFHGKPVLAEKEQVEAVSLVVFKLFQFLFSCLVHK